MISGLFNFASILCMFALFFLLGKDQERRHQKKYLIYNAFTKQEIDLMKKHIHMYENADEFKEFKLPSFYYMTIIKTIVSLSKK
jgi:hypothetical protein